MNSNESRDGSSTCLMSNLDCYMEDMLDCYEDFVRKSLLIISVALGALVVMIGYVLKVVTDRQNVPVSSTVTNSSALSAPINNSPRTVQNDTKTTQFSTVENTCPMKSLTDKCCLDVKPKLSLHFTQSSASTSKGSRTTVTKPSKTDSSMQQCPALPPIKTSCCSSCCPDSTKR